MFSMENSNAQRAYTVYDQHKREKAERRGVGFVAFLSDLDWMLSLELEEGRPLDDTKITTAQKFHVFGQAMAFGFGLHSAILLMMSIAFYSLLWSMHIESQIVAHFLWFGVIIFSLLVKFGIPLWLLEDYYIFPKGITYTYLSLFFFGYSLGLFIPELLYFLTILFFMGTYYILDATLTMQWWKTFSAFADKYLHHYTSWKYLPVHFLLLVLSFAPMWLLKRWRKKYPIETYPWIPLDFIPDEGGDGNIKKTKQAK